MEEMKKAKAEAAEKEKGGDLAEAASIEAEAQMQIEGAKLEQKMIQTQGDLAIQAAKVANEKQLTDIKMIQTIADIELSNKKLDLEEEKVDSENARSAVDLAISVAEKASKHQGVME
jgi:adhesin HecA-like repeat protein